MLRKSLLVLMTVIGFASAMLAQSVFDMPKLFPQHCRYLSDFVTALQRRNLLEAEIAARAAVKLFPNDANWHYNVACVCAQQARIDDAFAWLEKAIECGFDSVKQLQEDRDLLPLHQHPKFAELLTKAQGDDAKMRNATLSMALAQRVNYGQEVEITAENTQWNWDPVQGGYMTTLLHFVGDARANLLNYKGPYASLIGTWLSEGSAAGNAGDLYVNRDEDRTQLKTALFPNLTSAYYGDEAQQTRAHVGAANGTFSSGGVMYPVVGTSAVALTTTAFWRSLPRLITSEATADALSYRLAMMNQLYLYDVTPDITFQSNNDLLMAHTTQFLATMGNPTAQQDPTASMEALTELLFAGLAAMQPETKQRMIRQGLFVQTFQMLLRKSLKGSPDYCSSQAHPIVFDVEKLDGERFVKAAHALKVADLPVAFQIAARYESMPRQYVDYFDAPGSERISDTPWSIKRVIRGKDKTRKITVSAKSVEANVTYKWFVVSGNPEKIRIRLLTKDGALATIEVDYHGIFEQNGVRTRHVDIACVALRKGEPASAPCFVSFRYLGNEQRTYDEKGRIVTIDYRPQNGILNYEDPALTAFKNWCDTYAYDANGRLTGWTRTLSNGEEQRYDTQGRRVLETYADGSPKRVVEVRYFPRVNSQSDAVQTPAIELLQADTERILTL